MKFVVSGAAGNDGTYTVRHVDPPDDPALYDGRVTTIPIALSETIPSPTEGGILQLQRWESMVGNLAAAEVGFSVAWDPINQVAIAGFQDNGVAQQSISGTSHWTARMVGDGNTVAAAVNAGGNTVTRYGMANTFGYFRRNIRDMIQSERKFILATDLRKKMEVGKPIRVVGSTGNDGAYTVSGVSYASAVDLTIIAVSEAIPSGVIDGGIMFGDFGELSTLWRGTYDASNNLTSADWVPAKLAAPETVDQAGSGLADAARYYEGFTKAPYAVNAVDPDRLLIAADRLYESTDRGDLLSAIPIVGETSRYYDAVAYGWKESGGSIANIFYAAKESVVRTGYSRSADGTWQYREASLDGIGTGYARDLTIDPDNSHIAYLVDTRGHLWLTINAGEDWKEVAGDLPLVNPEASSVEAVMVMGRRMLLVGGRNGVYRAIPGVLADVAADTEILHWTELGSGLPNAIVTDIFYQNPFTDFHGEHRGDTLVVGNAGARRLEDGQRQGPP